MGFKDQMQADLDVFFNPEEFGEEGTYTHRSGGEVPVCVLFSGGGTGDDPRFDSVVGGEAEIDIRKDQVADPDYGDFLVLGGKKYDVKHRVRSGSMSNTVAISENRRPKLS